ATLLASPTTEPALKKLLQVAAGQKVPLDQALALVDQTQRQAATQAQTVAGQVTEAMRLSFANSITRIYFYTVWLVVAAFLLIIFGLPELPLRKTNRAEAPVPVFE